MSFKTRNSGNYLASIILNLVLIYNPLYVSEAPTPAIDMELRH